MKNGNGPDSSSLRSLAEQRLDRSGESLQKIDSDDPAKLLHELQVYQIELEMQNEELRTAQQEVDKALQRYQIMYEMVPVGFLTLNEAGVVVSMNLTAATLLGKERGSIVKRPLAQFFPSESRTEFEHFRRRMFSSGALESCEVKLTEHDRDNQKWLLAKGTAAGDETGCEPECHIVLSDITARKRIEAELRESEELNRKTLQALSDHITVIDRNGRILVVNDAWRIFALNNDAGGNPSVEVGANYCDVCRKASREGDLLAMQALSGIESVMFGSQEQFTLEYPCHSPLQQRWYLMSVVRYGSGDGAVIAHTDISDRKQAEALVLEHLEDLRCLNEELTLFNNAAVDRELRMIELKKEINDLCAELGLARRYDLDFGEGQ